MEAHQTFSKLKQLYNMYRHHINNKCSNTSWNKQNGNRTDISNLKARGESSLSESANMISKHYILV